MSHLFMSCQDERECPTENSNVIFSSFPVTIDEQNPSRTIACKGKKITFNLIPRKTGITTQGVGGGSYERDPNATLASVPKRVSTGKYKKYQTNDYPPFDNFSGLGIVLIRLCKYEFTCSAPPNTKQNSFDITPLTEEGDSEENLWSRGFTIEKIAVTNRGVFVHCSFYIKEGKGYNLLGQQIADGTPYPIAGEKVRYQFTYEIK